MPRDLPAALPSPQRGALSQFLSGQITAGELGERLRDAGAPAPGLAPDAPTFIAPPVPGARASRRAPMMRRLGVVVLVALAAGAGVAAGLAIHSGAPPVSAQTHLSAARSHRLQRHPAHWRRVGAAAKAAAPPAPVRISSVATVPAVLVTPARTLRVRHAATHPAGTRTSARVLRRTSAAKPSTSPAHTKPSTGGSTMTPGTTTTPGTTSSTSSVPTTTTGPTGSTPTPGAGQ